MEFVVTPKTNPMNEEEKPVVAETTEETAPEVGSEVEKTPEELKADYETEKARADKAEKLAENQKIRAEKAEKEAKKGKEEKPEKQPVMSSTDVFALVKANVAEEDIADVQEYATLKKISVSEALKSTVVKTILAEKTDFRKTAAASNTGNVRRGTVKATDEALIAEADKGNIPESEEDMKRLALARINAKRTKK